MRERIHANKRFLALFYDKCESLLDEEYTDEEVGIIIRAAAKYELYGEQCSFSDRALRQLYRDIRKDIDLSTEKANDISRKNRENARQRARDKSHGMTQEEIDAEIDAMFPRGLGKMPKV